MKYANGETRKPAERIPGSVRALEQRLPDGLIVDRKWLLEKGFKRPMVDFLLRSGRLVPVARGAYRRPGPPLKWEHIVYSLRALGYSVHVGGRSALMPTGHHPDVPLAASRCIDLRSLRKLPGWLDRADAPVKFEVHTTRLFASLPADALRTQPFGHWDWPLRYATTELAFFQLLADVRNDADFSVVDELFEAARLLRPQLVNKLLRACLQIKAKRLFLWFAARHAHPWSKEIESQGVDLGRGKRMIVSGGMLDTRLHITVPRVMALPSQPTHG